LLAGLALCIWKINTTLFVCHFISMPCSSSPGIKSAGKLMVETRALQSEVISEQPASPFQLDDDWPFHFNVLSLIDHLEQ